MAQTVNLGGDRLGSGAKMNVTLHSYERATFNLSTIRRTTIAPGTIVPIVTTIGLPDDTWDIETKLQILTQPTIGALLGFFDIQVDWFETAGRLYNKWLHNNKLDIGTRMKDVKIPQFVFKARKTDTLEDQLKANCILKYLGISGAGAIALDEPTGTEVQRQFNALGWISYWDIIKNYYANKQEEMCYYIHNGANTQLFPSNIQMNANTGGPIINKGNTGTPYTLVEGDTIWLTYGHNVTVDGPEAQMLKYIIFHGVPNTTENERDLRTIFNGIITLDSDPSKLKLTLTNLTYDGWQIQSWVEGTNQNPIQIEAFPLTNIDDVRDALIDGAGDIATVITDSWPAPFGPVLAEVDATPFNKYSYQFSQEGLGIKTYNSDLLNNWLKTESIGLISEISAIDTTSGSFTIDQLNLSDKLYNLMNRIVAAGSDYRAYINAAYDTHMMMAAATPVYKGSLVEEIGFQSILSQAATEGQPLGQRAGTGFLTNNKRGGHIRITPKEHVVIQAMLSITPQVDYSQANEWHVNLKNWGDFHVPALDEIGFQDLPQERGAWFGTEIDSTNALTFRVAGKQPAWIDYQTDVNRCYSSFAEENNEMFMTLNRRYEYDDVTNGVKDFTTYIDPSKYNFIFAETRLEATNFQVQVGVRATVRRKMSARLIPNL